MRLFIAAAAVLLGLNVSAEAAPIVLPNGVCVLFCNPTPAPSAPLALQKPVAPPPVPHARPRRPAPVVAAQKRVAHPAAAAKPSAPRPAPTAVASSPPAVAPQPLTPMVAPAEGVAFVQREPEPPMRLLAQAFAEHAQPAPAPTVAAELAPPTVAVALPPRTVGAVAANPGARFVQVTANGLVFPWWTASLPETVAIGFVALSLAAAGAFGWARASHRRIAA